MVQSKYIRQYAQTIHKIAKKEDGKITAKLLCSSIDENLDLLNRLIGVEIKKFRPLIPNLVY